jgi:AraC-like DNA-binding protein
MINDYEAELFGERYMGLERKIRLDPGLARSIDLSEARYRDPGLTVGEMARAACMSETVFRGRFRHAITIGPQQFIIRYRMMKALHLLNSLDSTISKTAMDAGFPDLRALDRHFKHLLGASPKEIRLRIRSEALKIRRL